MMFEAFIMVVHGVQQLGEGFITNVNKESASLQKWSHSVEQASCFQLGIGIIT